MTADALYASPSTGRHCYGATSPVDDPNRVSDHPIFAIDFNQISPDRVLARGQAVDPLTTALNAGAEGRAPPRDFRLLRAGGELQVLSRAKDYGIGSLAERLVQAGGKHYWRMGFRPGPNVRNEGSNEAEFVRCAPLSPRRASVRELMAARSAPGQVGIPPSMNADVPLGVSCVGHQSQWGASSSGDA